MKPPSWRIRRRIVIGTLLFCAGEIIYLTLWGDDTDLAATIANGVIILAGSTIGSYVFGAVWDDKNVLAMKSEREQPYTADYGYGHLPYPQPEPPKDFAG
jgi:hypothetical protein